MDALLEQVFKIVPIQYLTFVLSAGTIAVLFYGIRPVLKDLRDQVKRTNGSVIELKAWREGHDKQDDRRHEENLETLHEIKDTIRDIGKR